MRVVSTELPFTIFVPNRTINICRFSRDNTEEKGNGRIYADTNENATYLLGSVATHLPISELLRLVKLLAVVLLYFFVKVARLRGYEET